MDWFLRYLPVKNPKASGLQTSTRHSVALADRKHVGLDSPRQDRVRRLLGPEPPEAATFGGVLRLDDLLWRERRAAEGKELPLLHEVA
jgi:hypothetical protein